MSRSTSCPPLGRGPQAQRGQDYNKRPNAHPTQTQQLYPWLNTGRAKMRAQPGQRPAIHDLASLVGLGIKAFGTLRTFRAVPRPSTNRTICRLTSEVERDPVHSTRYGRQRTPCWDSALLRRLPTLKPLSGISRSCGIGAGAIRGVRCGKH